MLILGFMLMVGCGEDGPSGPASKVIVPEAWRGLWRITYTAYTCVGDSLVDASEDVRATRCRCTEREGIGEIESQIRDLRIMCWCECCDSSRRAANSRPPCFAK